MTRAKDLKDLEAYILGLVAEFQGCSPYFIHRTFRVSPSQFFSGSAGAIYPAVKRLEGRGLLKSSRAGTRGKPSKSLTLTKRGMEAYLGWYFNPGRAGDAGFDPMRGRIGMLGALPGAERDRALERLVTICRQRLEFLKTFTPDRGDGIGMARAVEVERATVAAKLNLLENWRNQSG